jgi:hypothetical protein
MPTTVPLLGHCFLLTRFSGNGNALNGANPPLVPDVLLVLDVLLLDVLDVELLLVLLELDVLLVLELEVDDVLLLLVLVVPLKIGAPNWPSPRVDWDTLSLTLKLKLTPTDSKKLSSTVMNRVSTVTCKSWSRRSCCKRSRISSWTFCV